MSLVYYRTLLSSVILLPQLLEKLGQQTPSSTRGLAWSLFNSESLA